jgi:hypothetical protein
MYAHFNILVEKVGNVRFEFLLFILSMGKLKCGQLRTESGSVDL